MANILAIDTGYGNVKIAYINPESKEMILDKFISTVAKLDKLDEFDDENAFQFLDSYYVLGSQALKLPREFIQQMNDYESLKELAPIWINFLLNKYERELGIKFDKIAIGLSLAFRDKGEDFLNHLEDVLMFPKDRYILLPQGVAIKKLLDMYGLSPLEPSKRSAFKYDSYVLFDLGQKTVDIGLMTSAVNSSSVNSSIGIEDIGVTKISFDIVDYIFKSTGITITREEAKVIIETGIFRRRGRNYDLSEQVKQFTLNYLISILDLPDTNAKVGSLVEGVDRIILCGGGAELWKKYEAELGPEIEKRGYPRNFWVTPEKGAEYFNAMSYLLIAQKVVEKDQQT